MILTQNFLSKWHYLEAIYSHPALAPPPRRMLVLVSFAQFYKSLTEVEKSALTTIFDQLLLDCCDWQTTVHKDALLEKMYMDRRTMKKDDSGNLMEPVANSGFEFSNFLRVFFVHSPDQTRVNDLQLLKSYVEIDLIIAFYFRKVLPQLLILVRDNMHIHPLLKAAWEFYCDGTPPNQVHVR